MALVPGLAIKHVMNSYNGIALRAKRLMECFLAANKYLLHMNIVYFIVKWMGGTEKVLKYNNLLALGLHHSQVHPSPVLYGDFNVNLSALEKKDNKPLRTVLY